RPPPPPPGRTARSVTRRPARRTARDAHDPCRASARGPRRGLAQPLPAPPSPCRSHARSTSLSLRPTRRAPAARTLAARRSAFEQRVDEAVGVEGGEIVHPLAEAHHLHRDAELALHVDDDAALGG